MIYAIALCAAGLHGQCVSGLLPMGPTFDSPRACLAALPAYLNGQDVSADGRLYSGNTTWYECIDESGQLVQPQSSDTSGAAEPDCIPGNGPCYIVLTCEPSQGPCFDMAKRLGGNDLAFVSLQECIADMTRVPGKLVGNRLYPAPPLDGGGSLYYECIKQPSSSQESVPAPAPQSYTIVECMQAWQPHCMLQQHPAFYDGAFDCVTALTSMARPTGPHIVIMPDDTLRLNGKSPDAWLQCYDTQSQVQSPSAVTAEGLTSPAISSREEAPVAQSSPPAVPSGAAVNAPVPAAPTNPAAVERCTEYLRSQHIVGQTDADITAACATQTQ